MLYTIYQLKLLKNAAAYLGYNWRIKVHFSANLFF